MNPAPSTIFYHIYSLKRKDVRDSVLVLPIITQNLLDRKEGAG